MVTIIFPPDGADDDGTEEHADKSYHEGGRDHRTTMLLRRVSLLGC